ARVPGRAVIEVSGQDASEFLQGIQCNHMPAIDQGGGGMLTAFLAPQGRMVADAFVYPKNAGVNFPHPVFLVEVDAQAKERVLKVMRFYKLRAKIEVRDATAEYDVWSVWGPGSMGLVAAADVWFLDERAPGMGLRLVVGKTARLQLPAGFEQTDERQYTLRRILKGVPEGIDDFVPDVSVPLECNLDYMHGVHFSKGCYVGQELTIRTHHRGVVRKRIVPVVYGSAAGGDGLAIDRGFSQAPAPQTDIIRVAVPGELQRTRRVPPGRTGSGVFNAGLALMRLEHVEQSVGRAADGGVWFETIGADGLRLRVWPWSPSWWP
ncbi:hypothetical protein BX070DRAFT_177213, partial [Coemansia spiralis]